MQSPVISEDIFSRHVVYKEQPFHRFDFESFALSDPVLGTAQATGVANEGAAIGDCATDQFSITGPNQGSPVICGTNTGQHSKNTKAMNKREH